MSGIDLARFIAFVGMVLVNYRIAIVEGLEGTPNWVRWILTRIDGRASAMFIILAGIGVSLMSRKARISGDAGAIWGVRKALLKRSAFLFVLGLLFYNVWPADILHFYGFYIAAGVVLLTAPTRRIWWVIGIVVAAGTLVTYLSSSAVGIIDTEGRPIDPDQPFWIALRNLDFWTASGFVRDLFIDGQHSVLPWLAFFLFGMVLGRMDLRAPAMRRKLFVGGLGTAAACHLISSILTHSQIPEPFGGVASALSVSPYDPGVLYMLAASGTACAAIAVALVIAARWDGAGWLNAMIVTGQMALSLYLGHILLVLVPLQLLGVLDANPTVLFSVQCSLAFSAIAVAISVAWRSRCARGPLELAMRRLTRS